MDDHPSNNYYERSALEALGIHLTVSTSTEDALEKIAINKYVAILSDMGRYPDRQAGYPLLEKLRTEELYKRNVDTPFIIYGRSNLPGDKAETKRRGGFGMTNNPQELFQLVINAINANQNG